MNIETTKPLAATDMADSLDTFGKPEAGKINSALLFLNDVPLAALDAKLEAMSDLERSELSINLSGVLEQAARVKGYLDGRYMQYNKPDHNAGVKSSNKLAAGIRKVLRFTYPRQDLSF